jgi:hypothetical protein
MQARWRLRCIELLARIEKPRSGEELKKKERILHSGEERVGARVMPSPAPARLPRSDFGMTGRHYPHRRRPTHGARTTSDHGNVSMVRADSRSGCARGRCDAGTQRETPAAWFCAP